MTTITRALLSVSDKTGIVELATALHNKGIAILSTGGTASLLKSRNIPVTDVSEHTGFPEIMDGRVKTLHPTIHGGILARRNISEHSQAMQAHGISAIDLIVVNLYPFEETVASGAEYDETVEQIDIGGPAMIRAAAKNHEHVAVVVDPADYAEVIVAIEDNDIDVSLRRRLAAKAFARTAAYDSAIARWFAEQEACDEWPPYLYDGVRKQVLRYGENPHQRAAFYVRHDAPPSVATATQHQGKELSYNNINDTDAAFKLVSEFEEPAVVIVKHANPCGVAIADNLVTAYEKAFACDPTSAYGGIIAVNRTIDARFIDTLGNLFLEVLIAPAIDEAALAILSQRKNLRVLTTGAMPLPGEPDWTVKSVGGGYLVQDADSEVWDEASISIASARQPTPSEKRDLLFAFTVCKHVKSNAIVVAKDGATIGIGAGQMSRIDSVRLAGWKAENAQLSTVGCVLASDAFFPFDDNVHRAAELGIVALIQPGGSIRDGDVIKAADHYDMAMLLTGMRHFNH